MLIREASDLHLEFFYDSLKPGKITNNYEAVINNFLHPLDTDQESILILSGDIVTVRKMEILKTLFSILLPRFRHIIYVLGNHEHYHGNILTTKILIEDLIETTFGTDSEKITVAGNDPVKVQIDDVIFMAGTLWTNYAGDKATSTHEIIERYISDHRAIQGSNMTGLKIVELIKIHKNTVKQFKSWFKNVDSKKVVMCTHHLPSFTAVDPQYLNNDDPIIRTLNHAFATDLDKFILEYKPAFWVFGHTHTCFYGKLGDTQLICNPCGYPNEKNSATGKYDRLNLFEV